MKIAVYPGSFDPITNGHLDIIKRACKVFDEIIVLVAINNKKKSCFSNEEKIKMIKEAVKEYKNVKVDSYDGLTVDYAKKHGAGVLIRGLRVVSDFEYEWSFAAANEYMLILFSLWRTKLLPLFLAVLLEKCLTVELISLALFLLLF